MKKKLTHLTNIIFGTRGSRIERLLFVFGAVCIVVSFVIIVFSIYWLNEHSHLELSKGINFEKLYSLGSFYGGTIGPLLTFATVSFLAANYILSIKSRKCDEARYINDKRIELKKHQLDEDEIKRRQWEESFYKIIEVLKAGYIIKHDEAKHMVKITDERIKELDSFSLTKIVILFLRKKAIPEKKVILIIENYIISIADAYQSAVNMLESCPIKNDTRMYYVYMQYLSTSLGASELSIVMHMTRESQYQTRYIILTKFLNQYFPFKKEYEDALESFY